MRSITKLLKGLCIISVLLISYPQNVCITTAKTVDNLSETISVVERKVNKSSPYYRESISFPVIKGGKNKIKIRKINDLLYNDILLNALKDEKIAKKEFGDENKVKPTFAYEVNSKFSVAKNDDKILSLYNDFYEYLGGAHGNTIRTSYTIDKNNENLITLKDLFVPQYNYSELINKEIAKKLDENPENYFYNGSNYKGIDKSVGFYIKDNTLIIYYPLYEIAPYVAGIPEFEIPLDLFGKNYIYT